MTRLAGYAIDEPGETSRTQAGQDETDSSIWATPIPSHFGSKWPELNATGLVAQAMTLDETLIQPILAASIELPASSPVTPAEQGATITRCQHDQPL